jgi:hypothetical protein
MSGELIGPLGDLERAGVVTPTSLRLPDDFDYDRAEAFARYLGRFRDASAWWLGDFVLQTERIFGERSYQLADATGRSEKTLENYVSVARAVAPARRRAALSWSHHRAVVRLQPSEQERWLARAEEEGWSVGRLTESVRAVSLGRPHVGSEELSRRARLEHLARTVWRSSTLNLTRTEYVTPVETMQALGRLLDGVDVPGDVVVGVVGDDAASGRRPSLTQRIVECIRERGVATRYQIVLEVAPQVDTARAVRKAGVHRLDKENHLDVICSGQKTFILESLRRLVRSGVITEDEDGYRLGNQP